MPVINLTEHRQRLLQSDGHLLVLGGPGSGKTTIALIKADQIFKSGKLIPGQKLLFLSFARATVSRIMEQSRKLSVCVGRGALEINTYHGFAWNILRSHGYLLNSQQRIRLFPPPEASARLADIAPELRDSEKQRLFQAEGLLHFDLFAPLCAELLSRSRQLRRIITDTYPLIIVDEFQDTNSAEWALIKALGDASTIIALADAEQRIYEFRGADPARILEFITAFNPTQFDFGNENHRSNGTDITTFGNELLTGANKGKSYKDVQITLYPFLSGYDQCFALKCGVLSGMKRLKVTNADKWSIAILVPTKRLMLAVSDYLSSTENSLPTLFHEVALDHEGTALSAAAIAALLEGGASKDEIAQRLIANLCTHMRGRRGGNEKTPQLELEMAGALDGYLASGTVRGSARKEIVAEAARIAGQRLQAELSGDPGADWLQMRRLLEQSSSDRIQHLGYNAKYLRMLNKGTVLRGRLDELWRADGSYRGATDVVKDALVQEHFSSSTRTWNGINVMTIHKAKGKEFDEVFIFEGYKQGKIVRANSTQREIQQARLALRVAVTRAMKRATILTPKSERCQFL